MCFYFFAWLLFHLFSHRLFSIIFSLFCLRVAPCGSLIFLFLFHYGMLYISFYTLLWTPVSRSCFTWFLERYLCPTSTSISSKSQTRLSVVVVSARRVTVLHFKHGLRSEMTFKLVSGVHTAYKYWSPGLLWSSDFLKDSMALMLTAGLFEFFNLT